MDFEWDESKNRANIAKHGISFEDVPTMFDYPMLTRIDDRTEYGEERWIGIGLLSATMAVVIYVELIGDTIRIISARRAKKHEQKEYTNRLGPSGEYDG